MILIEFVADSYSNFNLNRDDRFSSVKLKKTSEKYFGCFTLLLSGCCWQFPDSISCQDTGALQDGHDN